jgi:hypothetical protein
MIFFFFICPLHRVFEALPTLRKDSCYPHLFLCCLMLTFSRVRGTHRERKLCHDWPQVRPPTCHRRRRPHGQHMGFGQDRCPSCTLITVIEAFQFVESCSILTAHSIRLSRRRTHCSSFAVGICDSPHVESCWSYKRCGMR